MIVEMTTMIGGNTTMEEPKVKSLLKAMNLLDMFTQPPYEYGVSDLARKFNYPKFLLGRFLRVYLPYMIAVVVYYVVFAVAQSTNYQLFSKF